MSTLNYHRDGKKRIPIFKILVAITITIVLAWLAFAECTVDDFYVCQECGLRLRERHFYGFQLFTTRTETPSAVSEVLAAHGISYTHRWKFYHEHGRSLAGASRWACVTSRDMSCPYL